MKRLMSSEFTFPVNEKILSEAKKLLVVQELTEKDVSMFREVFKEALKSEDPNTQVGAIVINSDGNIIGRAYAHFPVDMESLFNWVPPTDKKATQYSKYPYIVKAEYTAAQEAKKYNNGNLDGCTMYMNLGCGDQPFAQLADEKLCEFVAMVPDGLDWDHLLSNAVLCVQSQKTDHPINIRFVKPFPEIKLRFKALSYTHPPGCKTLPKE